MRFGHPLILLQYLEYETVLGPEVEDEAAAAKARSQGATDMNQAAPGGANSLAGGATTAPGMLASTGRSATAQTHSGPTMANQGTGLGDLLTHGEGSGLTGTGLGGNTHVSLIALKVHGRTKIAPRRSIWRRIHHTSPTKD